MAKQVPIGITLLGMNPDINGSYMFYNIQPDGSINTIFSSQVGVGQENQAVVNITPTSSTYFYINIPTSSNVGEGPTTVLPVNSSDLVNPPTGFTPPVSTPTSFNYKVSGNDYIFVGIYSVLLSNPDNGAITGTYTTPDGKTTSISTKTLTDFTIPVPYGTTFNLTATPNAGYVFNGWLN